MSNNKNRSKMSLPPIEEIRGEEEEYFFRPLTKDDVIRTFFNQIVEMAIEDMAIIDPKEEEIQKESDSILVKDYQNLELSDLKNSEILSVNGSKVSLKKSTSRLSAKKKKSAASIKSSKSNILIQKDSIEKKVSKTSTTLSDSFLDGERSARIRFTNGNTYEGTISKRIMNGRGIYRWTDSTIYEGDFLDGFPTGQGQITLPDLSRYVGGFNQGLFHGEGFLNIVSTPTFYSGKWKDSKKHGKGWLLYEPGDWYEGEWSNDKKHGFGVRHYKNGAKYRGTWKEGFYDGKGMMIWENHDYYKGDWVRGLMDGQGEYIWNAFFNQSFTFPIQTVYRGSWSSGKRCGEGVMHFGGECGARLKGTWNQNFKEGQGCFICGDGSVVQSLNLFQCDKPSYRSEDGIEVSTIIPIFAVPEDVDVGYYIDKILVKLKDVSNEKKELLKKFEAKCIKNTIINFLPHLIELYRDYAAICAKEQPKHQVVLMRMFLWQLYKNVEVYKYGLSLVDTDKILAENPKSALDTLHYPFEPIYFWQFLMSLIGVALMTCSLDEEFEEPMIGGVCASIIKKFFIEIIFDNPPDHKSLVFSYIDMVPIKSVYKLYQKLGEPHSAKTFLRNCCTRKGELPILCHLEFLPKKSDPKFGTNMVPIANYVTFIKSSEEEDNKLSGEMKHDWTNLLDFRCLGPKNVIRCLTEVCPLIMEEELVVNIDYPLTFLEFYETLLICIFMVLDLEMKKEKKIYVPNEEPIKQTKLTTTINSKKKTTKKSGKSKKK